MPMTNIMPLSNEWFAKRRRMLTASSDIHNAINSNYSAILQNKTRPQWNGNIYTWHGQKYEKISLDIYSSRNEVRVQDKIPLCIHPVHTFIGGTPDGQVMTDPPSLIEIKCPRRVSKKIKPVYHTQMQTQMEVTDVDQCIFFECNIKEYDSREAYYADSFDEDDDETHRHNNNIAVDRLTATGYEKGVIGRIGYSSVSAYNRYLYPPMNLDTEGQLQWLDDNRAILKIKNIHLYYDYWKVEDDNTVRVDRDKQWWSTNLPKIVTAWEILNGQTTADETEQ